jgi:hypothetical protein
MKTCNACKNHKPLDDFYFQKDRGKHRNQCKQCEIIRITAYTKLNRDKVLEYKKRYREENTDKVRTEKQLWYQSNTEYMKQKNREKYIQTPDVNRNANLKKYGITIEDYEHMFKQQQGCCKICKSNDVKNKRVKHFAVDHDHKTGKVRGLLCHSCNRALGYLQDRLEVVEAAVDYLKAGQQS